jgi:hypothetical protein
VCACSPGARECETLQSVSSRHEDAGRNRRHPDGIGAIKLEAAPQRYHLQRFAPVCNRMHCMMGQAFPSSCKCCSDSCISEARLAFNKRADPREGCPSGSRFSCNSRHLGVIGEGPQESPRKHCRQP